MARPIPPKHFGAKYGALSVKFHNGETIVDGHIVRQIGTTRYVVSDGTVSKICDLAKTQDEAVALEEGKCAIFASNGSAIIKLTANHAHVEGEAAPVVWQAEENVAFAPVSFPEPEYLPEDAIVASVGEVSPQFTKGSNPRLLHGTGNPIQGMVIATNGDIELGGAIRRYRNNEILNVGENFTYAPLISETQDWTYVYHAGLLNPVVGGAITDLYHLTLDIETPRGSTQFVLVRGQDGSFQFGYGNRWIKDDTAALNGSCYQGIQRVRFYEEVLGGDKLKHNEFGSVMEKIKFTLTASPKAGNKAPPVSITWYADPQAA